VLIWLPLRKVVPMTSSSVVVGVDGSPNAEEAVSWAVDYARLSGAPLRLICAWEVPSLGGTVSSGDATVLSQAAEQVAASAANTLPPEVTCLEAVAIEGNPASVLIRESTGARLLVLGARGSGGFADILLGSVSTYCSHHAKCPVLIVRGLR
jgi:nucleotide-binding universal stress UspA family protein